MIVVIQCASEKRSDAGHLMTADEKPVVFVAHPELATLDERQAFARPDDMFDSSKTWRDVLLQYNDNPGNNPFGLLPAYRLYKNTIYRRLVSRFGANKVYILSAGWGLIKADFLTPYYDITFSHAQNVEPYKRRGKADVYKDWCMLSHSLDEEIVFFGGKDYLPLFCKLTEEAKGNRKIFYNSVVPPDAPVCKRERFETRRRTNWHYLCADAFLESMK